MKETFYEALGRIMSAPEEVAIPAHGTSLDLLREVYRDPAQPLSVRMRSSHRDPLRTPKAISERNSPRHWLWWRHGSAEAIPRDQRCD
jgi:hypothetical protein